MKKLMAIILALAISAAFAGCSGQNEDLPSIEGTPEEIIEKIYSEHPMNFDLMTVELMEAEDGFFKSETGLSDKSKIAEAASSMPEMTGAYSLVVVRVKNEAEAEEIAKEMLSGVDPFKWICMGATDVAAAVYKDVIVLVMTGENNPSSELFNAFNKITGKEATVFKK